MNNWIGFQFQLNNPHHGGVTPNRLPEIGSFGFNDNENNFCHKALLHLLFVRIVNLSFCLFDF